MSTFIIKDGKPWRIVPGFPEYLVSMDGEIVHKSRHTPLKTYKRASGVHVRLSRNGRPYTRLVSALVLHAFRGAPSRPNVGPIYRDNDYGNVKLENLEWSDWMLDGDRQVLV